MKFTCDVRGSLSDRTSLVMAKASPYVRTTCKKYAADIPDGQLIVNVAKGVEADTLMTMSQIIEGGSAGERMSLFSPDRATQRKSAAACRPRSLSARMTASALYVQNVFMSPVFPRLHKPGHHGN